MLERLFQKGAIPTLEKGVSFTARRHEVLANNIANVDTVYYKAQDLPVEEFQDVLRRSVDARRADPVGVFRWQGSGDLAENEFGAVEAPARRVPPTKSGILRHDKNNVSVEEEMAKIGKNSMMHMAMLDLLRKQFRMLDSALAERVEG